MAHAASMTGGNVVRDRNERRFLYPWRVGGDHGDERCRGETRTSGNEGRNATIVDHKGQAAITPSFRRQFDASGVCFQEIVSQEKHMREFDNEETVSEFDTGEREDQRGIAAGGYQMKANDLNTRLLLLRIY